MCARCRKEGSATTDVEQIRLSNFILLQLVADSGADDNEELSLQLLYLVLELSVLHVLQSFWFLFFHHDIVFVHVNVLNIAAKDILPDIVVALLLANKVPEALEKLLHVGLTAGICLCALNQLLLASRCYHIAEEV